MSSNELETVEQLRDLFPSSETPDTPAPEETPAEEQETVEPPEPEETPAEEETLLAGKYKTVQDLEAAYLEAQAAIGRQGSELGNLRKLEQEMEGLRAAIQQPAPQTYDPGTVEGFLAENPQQIPAIAEQAIAAGDGFLYQKALAAWGEYDQVGAMDFHARKVSEANIAQLRQEFQPALAGMQRQQTTNEMAVAYETMAQKHEDFNQVMNGVSQDTLNGFPPEVLTALQTGDQVSKERVLETLYRWTKAEQAGTLTQAATNAVTQAAQEARTDKANATVASQTGSLDREPVTLSPVEAYRQQMRESDAFKRASGELKHR